MAAVEHFEIPAEDMGRAQAFYRNVLAFDYRPWDDGMGMLVQPEGKGIDGDLHERGVLTHPTVVFTVDRIEDTLELVTAHGGQALGEIQPLSDAGRWVYIRDSEGNTIGLYDEGGAAAS